MRPPALPRCKALRLKGLGLFGFTALGVPGLAVDTTEASLRMELVLLGH